MIFYRIETGDDEIAIPAVGKERFFVGTLELAHRHAKTVAKHLWHHVFIAEIAVATTKDDISQLLNGFQTHTATKAIRNWKLSPRGGLVECDEEGHALSSTSPERTA